MTSRPTGCTPPELPSGAVDPRTVAPGVMGDKTERSEGGPACPAVFDSGWFCPPADGAWEGPAGAGRLDGPPGTGRGPGSWVAVSSAG
ncbi:DUF6009 family protein [Actinacidiphila soli]|uniref:DUF6009 family protein n=1 Tax=Actinacidiphila soli TaxID=2487275 RepID=UPI0038992149